MADDDDGEVSNKSKLLRMPQKSKVIQRTKRGPKKVGIRREGDSFGFTLRHFIVYPPDSIAESDDRYAAVGALSTPMDTIFVKHVKESSPARKAGLRQGDRLIKVNDVLVTNKTYSQVVQLIQNTPEVLHLVVVPKEDDILQRYFADSAYNPASNKDPERFLAGDRLSAQTFLAKTLNPRFQLDAISWHSLQNSYGYYDPTLTTSPPPPIGLITQRSADNLIDDYPSSSSSYRRGRTRAQPQTPSISGTRRASDGFTLINEHEAQLRGCNEQRPGCRLSMESGSLYDSNSTLTDLMMDDTAVNRMRRNMQQKEEFLAGGAVKQREFYSRAKKLEGAVWPPLEKSKPIHQNFQRVKNEIENERDLLVQKDDEQEAYTLPVVQTRAQQYERGQTEDDRTNAYCSELARLSSKKLVPNVTERAQEYETKSSGLRKLDRDTKSLESNDSTIGSTTSSMSDLVAKRLSGNVTISTGSKYIHCPPPSEYGKPTQISERSQHLRSNSADSWLMTEKRINRQEEISDKTLDDDRATRRESYLKATETGRMNIDSDLSDGDISPQVPRSGSSSSNVSLERDKSSIHREVIQREGILNCKITEIDGKRFSDRSWKQSWASLRNHQLFLYRDKNHQSPSDVIDPTISNGIDLQRSEVRVADDYTKRKYVLRVSSATKPSSAILLQAENGEDFSDWFKALQDQQEVGAQLAVPQSTPAITSIQTRNPSPISKTRKSTNPPDPISPKSKTWRFGRGFGKSKKTLGGVSPNSPTAPDGSTFGVALEQCLPSLHDPYVPKFVEVCTNIVDEKGLQTIGIYRVPGNNASITALSEEVNRNYDDIPIDDPRWNDLHVVSSLLKMYFRKIPDSLVTSYLYPSFIKADKIENPELRMKELKKLIKRLPTHNYHTLRHVIYHLRNVVDNCEINKMEAKNLAIVFGPNIVRTDDENMENMVHNMTHQCKIVESLLNAGEWFFSDDSEPLPLIVPVEKQDDPEPTNHSILLDNISKCEAVLKDKEKNGALLSSILSAAQRKVKRKSKGTGSLHESKEDVLSMSDCKENSDSKSNVIPTTVLDIEVVTPSPSAVQPVEKVPWFNYASDKEDFYKRIETFRQETHAMLQMPRNVQISVNNLPAQKSLDCQLLKTNSASNVFARSVQDNRLSLDHSYQYHKTDNDGDYIDTNRNNRFTARRTSSVENVTNSDINANGAIKKVKYHVEGDGQRMGSLDSLNKVSSDDATDLTSVITLLDKKLNKNSKENLLSGEGLPYVDDSPEKCHKSVATTNKENVPNLNDLYRNPSLHKNSTNVKTKMCVHQDSDKDEDSTMLQPTTKKSPSIVLKRSESLNKPNEKLIKVKRSDSLTKTEKTECNLNKKRELTSLRRSCYNKDISTKLKRKNGMPDRSIKRRHTVGGTKDPDKITWFKKEDKSSKEENKRTSSPDLSTTRRERLFLEINLIGPENMVMALKQHLIGARPQSFPDTATVFQVPLESHV